MLQHILYVTTGICRLRIPPRNAMRADERCQPLRSQPVPTLDPKNDTNTFHI